MAEIMTPQGLVVGLIVDQPNPKPLETAPEEAQVKKPGRPPKQK